MACPPSSSHAPAWWLRTRTPSRSLTSGPSLATRLSPSRTGLTSSDVGPPQRRHRARVVVARVEQDRGPCSGRPHLALTWAASDRTSCPYARYSARPKPGRVDHGRENHPPAEVRAACEQLVEGPEAAQHVLGQLHAVDPHDELAVADRRVEVGARASHSGDAATAAEVLDVGGGRGHESRRAARPRRVPGSRPRRPGPTPGVEPARTRRRPVPRGCAVATASGSTASSCGEHHGVWTKAASCTFGSARGEQARDQRQLVVLDQHGGPRRGCVGRDRRERSLTAWKRLPRGPPVAVEAGASGQVPQPVQAEPQGLVGDHVVVGAVVGRVDQHRAGPGNPPPPRTGPARPLPRRPSRRRPPATGPRRAPRPVPG